MNSIERQLNKAARGGDRLNKVCDDHGPYLSRYDSEKGWSGCFKCLKEMPRELPPKFQQMINDPPKRKDEQCPDHGKYESTSHLTGIWSKCPDCQKLADIAKHKETAMQAAKLQEAKLKRRIEQARIPPIFLNLNFSSFRMFVKQQESIIATCKRFVDEFAPGRNGGSLVMVGNHGTGKSMLAAIIANVLLHRGRSVYYTTVIDAVMRVRDTWSRDTPERMSQAIAAMVEPDLLILDDVGAETGSDSEQTIIYAVIQARYQELRPTIITSNLQIGDISKYLGKRSTERLRENSPPIMIFDWESQRKFASE